MVLPLSHEALLTLAYRLEADAADGERERVRTTSRRLLDAFVEHLGAERLDVARLPEGGSALVQGGQRMLDLLVELAQDASTSDLSRCDRLAQQFIAELTLQADEERRSLVRSV